MLRDSLATFAVAGMLGVSAAFFASSCVGQIETCDDTLTCVRGSSASASHTSSSTSSTSSTASSSSGGGAGGSGTKDGGGTGGAPTDGGNEDGGNDGGGTGGAPPDDGGPGDAASDAPIDSPDDAPTCTFGSDCPVVTCQTAACPNGTCSYSNLSAHTPCAAPGAVCDGRGACVGCVDPTDCPVASAACTQASCVQATCGTQNAPLGTKCSSAGGGKVCDSKGDCLQCNKNSDCTSAPNTYCSVKPGAVGTCTTQCNDGVQDPGETGIDCGGTVCGVCSGQACPAPGPVTCASGICAGGTCCETSCNGACQTCSTGTCANVTPGTSTQKCAAPAVCDVAGACVLPVGAACTINGPTPCDTGLTCAYGQCRYNNGMGCIDPYDCASGLCDAGVCASCTNTDAGTNCGPGRICTPSNTCLSGYGDPCGPSTDCVAPAGCNQGICNETIGGCTADNECSSNHCASSLCAACGLFSACPTGITCTTAACGLTSKSYCSVNAQCNSMSCTGFPSRCQ